MSWRDKIAAVLAGKVGGPTPQGIHVYHSSPHDFDRFENRLLTGEGANVYGAGTYLAENPKVSGQGGQYWNSFLQRFENTPEGYAAEALQASKFDRTAALEASQRNIDKLAGWVDQYRGATTQPAASNWRVYENELKQARDQHDLLTKGPVGPRTYEVNFKAKPEELLDWDRPLKYQPEVLDKIQSNFVYPFKPEETGASVYTGFVSYPFVGGASSRDEAKRIISDKLGEAGVPGIRYLDEGSRNMYGAHQGMIDNYGSREAALANAQKRLASGMGDPEHYRSAVEVLSKPQTHNYVAFDPSRLDIMAKYGVIGGVPLGAATMGGTIDQSSYGARQ